MKNWFWLICFLVAPFVAFTQNQGSNDSLVQLSGLVVTEQNGQPIPIPYTDVYVKNKSRGTYSDLKGYFSFVVEKGDRIIVSAVGFNRRQFRLPHHIQDNRYSIVQVLEPDTITLPEAFIYPWPSREHFTIEFLAMDGKNSFQDIAMKNLAKESVAKMTRKLSYDGAENSKTYFAQQAQKQYYQGQFQPLNLFNPSAWQQFFNSFKSKSYKRTNAEKEEDDEKDN